MAKYVLERLAEKGYGLVVAQNIAKDELLIHVDLRGLEKYTLPQLERLVEANPGLDGDHANYVGRGKYVLEFTPASYMNHACNPNCYFKMKSIAVYDVYALRDIAAGEELTHDYTASAIDQFAGQVSWVLECKCGSADCRQNVTGDFFDMPTEWQAKYHPYLPPSIKRKYKDRFSLPR